MKDQVLGRLKPFIQGAIVFAARIVRPMTLGVRVLVRDTGGRVLLVRHSYLPGWYLPGGGVDAGETLAGAALRELREEAGLIGEAPRLVGIYQNARISKRDHVALYRIERFRAAVPAWTPNSEIVEIGFFPADALPDGTTAATRMRIAEVLHGADPTDIW